MDRCYDASLTQGSFTAVKTHFNAIMNPLSLWLTGPCKFVAGRRAEGIDSREQHTEPNTPCSVLVQVVPPKSLPPPRQLLLPLLLLHGVGQQRATHRGGGVGPAPWQAGAILLVLDAFLLAKQQQVPLGGCAACAGVCAGWKKAQIYRRGHQMASRK